ncbi:MAG: hypothetical protein HYU98_03815 [Deltaproteobacteria bacterium]|nr:hypothetical protein [Deltaproteobacteria bacterium]
MPVEKVDKPEPPPTYYVESAVETKDDRGRRQNQQGQSDEYSGSHAAPGWQKIYASASNRRYFKLRREDIAKAWFRGTAMQRGISLAELDIQIKDGKILKGAHVILPTREDFWTLKSFQPGQEVPLNIFVKEPFVEISLPGPKTAPAPQTSQSSAKTAVQIDNRKLYIYAAIGFAVLLAIIYIIFRL